MFRIIKLIVLLLVAVAGAAFAVMNATPVRIDYYFGQQELPLALIVAASLLLGALLGILSGVGALLRQRHEMSRLRRKQKVAQQEIDNLRTLPIKD